MSFQYYNYYDDDSDGDNASVSSSGDEGGIPVDIVLSHGKDGGRRRFRLERPRSRSSSRSSSRSRSRSRRDSIPAVETAVSHDSNSSTSCMEEEMEKELDRTVEAARAEYNRQLHVASMPAPQLLAPSATNVQIPTERKQEGDDVDDDDDDVNEDVAEIVSKSKDKSPTEDLFYDPDMDDQDKKWIDNIRFQYQPQGAAVSQTQSRPLRLPNSDAVLNCPACMSLLCVDCQRHDLYSHQYRAMFVFNCKVDKSQAMQYNEKSLPGRKRGHRSRKNDFFANDDSEASTSNPPVVVSTDQPSSSSGNAMNSMDLYWPTYCTVCNTCIAMFDAEEVYHFFNVLASHA